MGGRAIVVGGGIGGLAAAVGLHRGGWDVTVLEQSESFGEIGAGIMLWPNALKALRFLGLSDRLNAIVKPQLAGGVRTSDGRWLSRWEGPVLREMLGDTTAGIHRASLHRTLLEELPARALRAGTKVDDHRELDADLVVAADGIGSGVRRRLLPGHPGPVYGGATAWRGICEPLETSDIGISWGRGTEFGIVPLVDGRIYWYASKLAPPGRFFDDEKAAVLRDFGSWHEPIGALIEHTPSVLHHDLYHLAEPLPSFVFGGRVALLGDAAHAMVPNLGQGACQALEDAAVLKLAVERHGDDVASVLAFYDSRRRPRAQSVARLSARTARFVTNVKNPVGVAVRNGIVRLTPGMMSIRGMAGVAKWDVTDGA
ncbi:MAG TPA: FAD-dependent monooxygenase [Candidatus Limnocylindrales bacterium]